MALHNATAAQPTTKRPLTQPSPGAPKAAPGPVEREDLLLTKVDRPRGRGMFGWIGIAVGTAKQKPDFSEEGFMTAARQAITFATNYNFNSADEMEMEIERQVSAAVRVNGGIRARWSATHKVTKHPRLVITAEWGFCFAVDGQVSFDPVRSLARARP